MTAQPAPAYPPLPHEAAIIADLRRQFQILAGNSVLTQRGTVIAMITIRGRRTRKVTVKAELEIETELDPKQPVM